MLYRGKRGGRSGAVSRALIFFMVSAMLAPALFSCGLIEINDGKRGGTATQEQGTAQTTAGSTSAAADNTPAPAVRPVETKDNLSAAKKYLDALIKRDLGGVAVNITTVDAATFVPDNVGTLVNSARIERNRMVEDKYDTKILATAADAQRIFDDASAAVKSGDYYSDMICVPMSRLGSFVSAGLLLNMKSLPFTDYTAPYYDWNAMLQTAAGYSVYGAFGDFNFNIDYLYCIYFNREIIKKAGLESPYELVYSGGWTWDKFREMTRSLSTLNGVWGHGSSVDLGGYIDILYASAGERYFSTGVGSIPELNEPTARSEGMASLLRSLTHGDGTVFDGGKMNGAYSPDGALNAFYSGKILFYTDTMYAASWFADMKDEWGVLPMPKYDASDAGYTSYCSLSSPVTAVPASSATVENTGIVLQAANAASYGFISDVYYDQLTRSIIRDSDTLNMIDYIAAIKDGCGIYYDFAHMFGEAYPYVADNSYSVVRTAVTRGDTLADLFAGKKAAVAKRLEASFKMFY